MFIFTMLYGHCVTLSHHVCACANKYPAGNNPVFIQPWFITFGMFFLLLFLKTLNNNLINLLNNLISYTLSYCLMYL